MIVLSRDVLKRLMVWHLVAGALVGVLVLQPVNDLIYWTQHDTAFPTAWGYVWQEFSASIIGPRWNKGLFYAGVGALVGALTAVFSRRVLKQQRRMVQLTLELERDLIAIIAKGESSRAEFKSSFRWDVKADKLNKALEHPVLKSLAAFLNSDGGRLLIGVSDDGAILGLARDYQTLKKKDRDGFEQAIMTAVSSKMGTDVCANLQVVFHAAAGDDVCRIIVNPSPRPVYLSQGKETEFYVRTGTSTRQLNVQEAIEYIHSRWPK